MYYENYLGLIIKDIRKSRGLTQRELAEDICSIKQLSRIESNKSSPSAVLLSQLSSKLGNTLNNYIPYSDCRNGFLLKSEIDELMSLYHVRDYELILSKIQTSTVIKETTSEYGKKEILWLEYAISFNTNNQVLFTDEQVKSYLSFGENINEIFTRSICPIEFRFLNSMICQMADNEQSLEAIDLTKRAISNFEKYYNNITDTSYVRLLSNLSKLHYNSENYNESIEASEKGINHCLSHNKTDYLADLYLTGGRSHFSIGNKLVGKEYLQNYISLRKIFTPQTNLNYDEMFNSLIEQYGLNDD